MLTDEDVGASAITSLMLSLGSSQMHFFLSLSLSICLPLSISFGRKGWCHYQHRRLSVHSSSPRCCLLCRQWEETGQRVIEQRRRETPLSDTASMRIPLSPPFTAQPHNYPVGFFHMLVTYYYFPTHTIWVFSECHRGWTFTHTRTHMRAHTHRRLLRRWKRMWINYVLRFYFVWGALNNVLISCLCPLFLLMSFFSSCLCVCASMVI